VLPRTHIKRLLKQKLPPNYQISSDSINFVIEKLESMVSSWGEQAKRFVDLDKRKTLLLRDMEMSLDSRESLTQIIPRVK